MPAALTPAPETPPASPPTASTRSTARLRRQVFLGIFVGYAAYYLVRNTFALVIPDLLKLYPQSSKAMWGTAMTGLSIAYGLSKFLMGSVSDRSNPKYFLPLGLLLSAGIIFVSGTVRWIYASLALVIALQTLNGWVQGMGWPPSGKTMVHWWSTKERGLTVSTWNVAHNVGGALVASFALLGVHALQRLGCQVLLQRRGGGSGRRGRLLPAARHAADRAACRRSRSTRTTTPRTTAPTTSGCSPTARSSSSTS